VFHAWAKDHDFQSTLLTDQEKEVTLQMIKDGVNAAITAGATQLLIYFGGHGILKAPETEIWLLSGAMNDSQQAVNLAGSVALARNGKIPNVIFISDACRSVTTNQTLFRITGGEIFPPDFVPRHSAELDRLYATLPGSTAADFADTDGAGKYHGVYTKCLMRALGGQEPSAIETITDKGIGFSAVSSRSLKPYLFRSVQDAAAQINITLNQDPDSIVESQPPKYIVKIRQQPDTSRQPPTPVGPILPVGGPAVILKTAMGEFECGSRSRGTCECRRSAARGGYKSDSGGSGARQLRDVYRIHGGGRTDCRCPNKWDFLRRIFGELGTR
jgi:hypothetical protein